MRNGLHLDQALPDEVFDIGPLSAFVGAIGELRQVLLSNRAKRADFNHRCDFRGPETIGPAPDSVDVARLRRASRAEIGMGTCPLGTLFPHLVTRLVITGWPLGFRFALLGDLAWADALFGFVAAGHFNRTPLQTKALAPRTHPCETVCRDGRVFARCP